MATAAEIIAANAITQTEVEFTVRGIDYRAQVPADASEIIGLEREAQAWASALKKQDGRITDDVVRMCLFVAKLVIEPAWSLDEALQASRTCGMLIPEIAGQLVAVVGGPAVDAEAHAIDVEGEG